MKFASLLIGLMLFMVFDRLSDPVSGLADGLFGSLTPVAVGLACLSFLLWGPFPCASKIGKTIRQHPIST